MDRSSLLSPLPSPPPHPPLSLGQERGCPTLGRLNFSPDANVSARPSHGPGQGGVGPRVNEAITVTTDPARALHPGLPLRGREEAAYCPKNGLSMTIPLHGSILMHFSDFCNISRCSEGMSCSASFRARSPSQFLPTPASAAGEIECVCLERVCGHVVLMVRLKVFTQPICARVAQPKDLLSSPVDLKNVNGTPVYFRSRNSRRAKFKSL